MLCDGVRVYHHCLLLPVQSLGLQPEEGFILKIVQLQELIDVRHSVFVIGNAGTGKSQVPIHTFIMYGLYYVT